MFNFEKKNILNRKTHEQSRAVLFRELATLINSGVTAVRALEVVSEQTEDKVMKEVLESITAHVEMGFPINRAFSKHPNVFTYLHTGMIRTAEESGTLHCILEQLAQFEERDLLFKRKIRAALTYPAFVIFVSLGVVFILLRFIIPAILSTVRDVDVTGIALTTRALLAVSRFLENPWGFMIIISIFLMWVLLARIYIATPQGKFHIEKVKFSLPIIGKYLQKIMVIRICSLVETLYRAGIPAMDALRIAGEVIGNEYVKENVFDIVSERIREGDGIARAMELTGAFPQLVTQMIAVGEDTGKLGFMLKKVTDIFAVEVECGIQQLTSLIEPVMITGLGVFTCLILLAAFLPIYQVIGNIKI